MSRERMTGRILIVWEDTVGTVLTSDAAAGATVLNVDDVSPFNGATNDDGPGGWLQVGDQVVQYTGIDDDASTITLAAPLAAAVTAASETDDVLVWNDLYGEPDTVQWAEVKPSGKRNQADTIEAVVADSVDGLMNGDRGGPGESCTLVRDGDEWEITAVRGRPSSAKGVKFEDQDTFTATDDGPQLFVLSHKPTVGSVHMGYGGLWQPHTEFTVDYAHARVSVPDSPSGQLKVDDLFDFRYARRGEPAELECFQDVVLADGPWGLWSFEEAVDPNNTLPYQDGTGGGHAVVNNNPVRTSGLKGVNEPCGNGKSIYLDGTTTPVGQITTSGMGGHTEFAAQMMVKYPGAVTAGSILSMAGSTDPTSKWRFALDASGRPILTTFGSSGGEAVVSASASNPLTDGAVHIIGFSVSYSRGVAKVFVDGGVVAQGTVLANTSDPGFVIGADGVGGGGRVGGAYLDEVSYWNRSPTEQQFKNHWVTAQRGMA